MDTQIVYVSVSSQEDLFLEQLWASVFSLRRFHPEATVLVLTDEPTAMRINSDTYQAMRDLITEVKVVEVTEGFDGRQRSREIKTSIRNIIDGDFLYIDTDTIITAPIDDLDRLDVKNMAMVPDFHRPSWSEAGLITITWKKKAKELFDIDISDAPVLFNGGAFFVRDNTFTREFFTKWHENWLLSVSKGCSTDQQSLNFTDKNYGYVIEKLPDVYNCQVLMGVKYLHEAKILHIYRLVRLSASDPLRVLWDVYDKIRQYGGVSEEVKDILANAKSCLSIHSCIVSYLEVDFLEGEFYQHCKNNRILRWCINKYNYWKENRRTKKLH